MRRADIWHKTRSATTPTAGFNMGQVPPGSGRRRYCGPIEDGRGVVIWNSAGYDGNPHDILTGFEKLSAGASIPVRG